MGVGKIRNQTCVCGSGKMVVTAAEIASMLTYSVAMIGFGGGHLCFALCR